MKPVISVIMAVYNAEQFVSDTIVSLQNQTFTEFEVIIIDDASTDSTYSILNRITDSRFIVMRNESNCGLTVNLNKALKIARGKYIARIDGDDICTVDRLMIQYNYMENHPYVDILGSNAYLIDANNKIVGVSDEELTNAGIKEKILLLNPFIHPTVMAKADVLKDNLYNENYRTCQDYELWSRLQNKYTYETLKKPTIFYRLNYEGATRSAKNDITKRICLLTPIIRMNAEAKGISLSDSEISVLLSLVLQIHSSDDSEVIGAYRKVRNKSLDIQMAFTLVRYFKAKLLLFGEFRILYIGICNIFRYYSRIFYIRFCGIKAKENLRSALNSPKKNVSGVSCDGK